MITTLLSSTIFWLASGATVIVAGICWLVVRARRIARLEEIQREAARLSSEQLAASRDRIRSGAPESTSGARLAR